MYLTKKLTFLFLTLLTVSNSLSAQTNNEYMDLLVLYVDEDYEKCIKKAEKYMDKDETKRDALPYLYSSMAYYEMSRDHKYSEAYPRAYKTSLSYLSKYRKKDKDYKYKEDALEFTEKLKFEIGEQVDNYLLTGTDKDLRKIKSLLKKLVKIDPDDVGAQLLLGVYYIYTKDKSSGKIEIKEALEKLEGFGTDIKFKDLTASQQYFLKEGLIAYYEYKHESDPAEAKKILLLGKPYFIKGEEDLLIENISDYLKALQETNS